MSSSSPIANKVAIVIGGSRGLGRGIVEALASRGVRLQVMARTERALAALSHEVSGVVPVVGDATDEVLAERLLRRASPDFVVLCAGMSPPLGPLHEQTWESFSANWNVDARAAFVWLRLALHLPMKPGSHVVVVSSGAAVQGSPVSGGYASAKRAQWFMTDYAQTEANRATLQLKFHCLLPNLNPSTELGRAGIAAYAKRNGVSSEEFAKRFQPPLTPDIMGSGVVELLEAPEKWSQLAYRIGGGGLTALG